MANAYYLHQTVCTPEEASIFSDQYTWNIFDILRKSSPKGLTANEVHQKLEKKMRVPVSTSKVYALLKRFYQLRWVHRYYDKDAQAQRIAIALDWGGIIVDRDFHSAVFAKKSDFITNRLFPIFLEFVKETMKELDKDPATRNWVPQSDYCKVCAKSHEAYEFVVSLLDMAAAELIESNELKTFMKKNGFYDAGEEDEQMGYFVHHPEDASRIARKK